MELWHDFPHKQVVAKVVAKVMFLVFFFFFIPCRVKRKPWGWVLFLCEREYTLRIPNNNLLCQPNALSHDKQRELDKSKGEFVLTFGNRAYLKKVIVLKSVF